MAMYFFFFYKYVFTIKLIFMCMKKKVLDVSKLTSVKCWKSITFSRYRKCVFRRTITLKCVATLWQLRLESGAVNFYTRWWSVLYQLESRPLRHKISFQTSPIKNLIALLNTVYLYIEAQVIYLTMIIS